MATENAEGTEYLVREAVAIFDDVDRLEEAIEDLQIAGFDRSQINVITSEESAQGKLGRRVGDVKEVRKEPDAPVDHPADRHEMAEAKTSIWAGAALLGSYVAAGAVVFTGGTLAAAFAAALAAGGVSGGIGGLLARSLGQHRADELQAQIERGGLLLWVTVPTPEAETKARDILEKRAAHDVEIHEVKRQWGDKEIPMRRWQPDPLLLKN